MPSNPYTDPVIVVNTSADYAESVGNLSVDDPYAPTSWGEPTEFDFKCPSGQLCRMRQIDVLELMETDLISQVDFLTGTVHKEAIPQNRAARRAQKPVEEAKYVEDSAADIVKRLQDDPKKSSEFFGTVEQIVLRAVVKPQLFPNPEPGSPDAPGRIYVKHLKPDDKIAIFNKAMEGTAKLKNFREESEESQRTVENGEGV